MSSLKQQTNQSTMWGLSGPKIAAMILLMSSLATSRPLLTVMLLIAAMMLPAAGNVLCIGPDGHAAIETAHPVSGCDDSEGRATESAGWFVASASDDCFDLPLATVEWLPRLEREQKQFDASMLDLLTPIYVIAPASDANASFTPFHLSRWADQDRVPELLLSLRSTVLLL